MTTVTAQQFTRELCAAEKGGLAQEVAKELGKQAQLAVGYIVGRHLSGPRGGAHTLGVITSRLRSSVRATTPVVNGTRIECSIGTNVSYAGVHEFGFNGTVSVRAHQRRLAKTITTGKNGNPLKRPHVPPPCGRNGAKTTRAPTSPPKHRHPLAR